MNKFQDMQCFVAVAELGSFTGASRRLNLSTSAVTKCVNRLEDNLGVQLLVRSTRRMHLTNHGISYCERCKAILVDVEDAEDALLDASESTVGNVRIAMPPAFARKTFIPALARFYELYPDVTIDLQLKGQTSNPIEGGYDLVVHSGRLPDSRLINRILVRGSQRTVASPAYIARYGLPKVPADLTGHRCITGAFGPNWTFREPSGGDQVVRVTGPLVTDSGDIMREAALEGLGITQATWWLFRQALETGALVPILTEYETEALPISIVFPAHRVTPSKVRVVVDFLVDLTRDSTL